MQEGVSRPKIIGEGTTPIIWPRIAVQAVGRAIKRGLQFFKDHNTGTNSTEDRQSFGEVVGKITKEIGGKLHQIVVGYFPDKQATADCDVCSIEADAVLQSDDSNNLVAKAITKLTGIALGNSDRDNPGFAGAVRLGSIQAFGDPKPDPDPEPDNKNKRKEIPMITFKDVKEFVVNNNVWPNQLFEMDVIKNDKVLGKVYTDMATLQADFDKLTTDHTDLKENTEKIQKEFHKNGAEGRLTKLIPDGTTDKQKEFLVKQFDADKIEDLSDDGLKKFIDTGMEDFKKYASIFNEGKPGDPIKKKEVQEPNESDEEKTDIDKVVDDITSDADEK